ncbi:hypothetical protein BDV95DRAFT_337643 [Massariosphaeria phaeospora]|uniref:Uncharacterized protein n=1 Tax=Massariosphaeria phaeospora TaxID=100035 RepID=A0A7C8IDY9_9PLEO|nr:hypothetical protein BDV95DRAFT_337643 [Massariosphaeria phaeospora]
MIPRFRRQARPQTQDFRAIPPPNAIRSYYIYLFRGHILVLRNICHFNDTEKISMAPALRMTRSIKEKLPFFFAGSIVRVSQQTLFRLLKNQILREHANIAEYDHLQHQSCCFLSMQDN